MALALCCLQLIYPGWAGCCAGCPPPAVQSSMLCHFRCQNVTAFNLKEEGRVFAKSCRKNGSLCALIWVINTVMHRRCAVINCRPCKAVPASTVEAEVAFLILCSSQCDRAATTAAPCLWLTAKIALVMYSNYCFLFHSSIHFLYQLPAALGVAGVAGANPSRLYNDSGVTAWTSCRSIAGPHSKTNDYSLTDRHTHTQKNTQ